MAPMWAHFFKKSRTAMMMRDEMMIYIYIKSY